VPVVVVIIWFAVSPSGPASSIARSAGDGWTPSARGNPPRSVARLQQAASRQR
jgi:hypothetical protein